MIKNNSVAQRSVFFLVILITVLLACKKPEPVTIPQHSADFSVKIIDPSDLTQSFKLIPALSTLVDSSFYFFNYATSGDKFSYHWDFGDGASSTEKNPNHSYSKRGTYTVTLIVSNQNKAFDTSSQNLTVLLGRRFISLGQASLAPSAIEETASNDFLMIGANNTSSYLFTLDSSLKQKNVKTFPSTYWFNSIKATIDANYVLTGTTQTFGKSDEMVKMTSNGTLLWNKVLFANDIYSDVTPAADGGYVVVGSRLYQAIYGLTAHTVVVKTDNNGNVQWHKLFGAEGMRFTKNCVVEQDGVVVAGIKRGFSCSGTSAFGCDSIFVVKLNNSGNIVWKNTVLEGRGNDSWWDTHITKLTNGNYAVANMYEQDILFFSPSGNFLDRKVAPGKVRALMNSADGKIIVLNYENGDQFSVAKHTLDGTQQWVVNEFNSQPLSIQPLRKGGILITGSYISDVVAGYNHYDVLLMQVDEAGKPK